MVATRGKKLLLRSFLSFFLYFPITLNRSTLFSFKRRFPPFSMQESREKHSADINVVIISNIVTITRVESPLYYELYYTNEYYSFDVRS